VTSLHDLMIRTPGLPCRTDPGPWFSPDPTERRDAAQRCRACPLLLACMRYALDAREQHGVWGGVDFEARAIGCGTERGYRVHRRRGEQPCPRCQAAYDEAVEAERRRLLAVAHAAGGTVRGYWMHRRLGEEACVPCKRACARQSKARRDREREAAERAREAWDDRRGAEALPGRQAGVQRLALSA
jgi:hypothetical protein